MISAVHIVYQMCDFVGLNSSREYNENCQLKPFILTLLGLIFRLHNLPHKVLKLIKVRYNAFQFERFSSMLFHSNGTLFRQNSILMLR